MAAVSKSEDRFIRLNKLVDLGTVALRKKFDILIPPGKLQKTLDTFKSSITHKISRQEKNRLYPPLGDPVTSDDLDLMSMVRVLRNTVLDEPLSGFGCHPKDRDISFAADVKRIQISRNTLDHTDYRKLEKHKCENMSHTLIEVIKRLDEPGVVDQIRHVMTGSLDYRANSITWHAQETIALLPNAFDECVFQPAKALVIQQNEKQPLYHSIVGGTVLSYVMPDISEIHSREELLNYLQEVQNIAVRTGIFILNEYPSLNKKIAELNLCYRKQDNSSNDITPVDLSTEGNVTIPGSNSTLNLDLPYTNDTLFEKQSYNPLSCLKMLCNSLSEYKSNTSYSRLLNVGRCNSLKSNDENNFDATCRMKQNYEFPSSSQSSRICRGSSWSTANGNVSFKNATVGFLHPFNPFIRFPQTSTPCDAKVKKVNPTACPDNSVTNLSRFDLKESLYCLIWKKDHEPAKEKERDPPSELRMYIWLMILCFVLYTIIKVLYPYLYYIFKSRQDAVMFTALVVLLYLSFIIYIHINYLMYM